MAEQCDCGERRVHCCGCVEWSSLMNSFSFVDFDHLVDGDWLADNRWDMDRRYHCWLHWSQLQHKGHWCRMEGNPKIVKGNVSVNSSFTYWILVQLQYWVQQLCSKSLVSPKNRYQLCRSLDPSTYWCQSYRAVGGKDFWMWNKNFTFDSLAKWLHEQRYSG